MQCRVRTGCVPSKKGRAAMLRQVCASDEAVMVEIDPESHRRLCAATKLKHEIGGHFNVNWNTGRLTAVINQGEDDRVTVEHSVVNFHTHPLHIYVAPTNQDLITLLTNSRDGLMVHLLYTPHSVYIIRVTERLQLKGDAYMRKLIALWSQERDGIHSPAYLRKVGFSLHRLPHKRIPRFRLPCKPRRMLLEADQGWLRT